MMRFRRWLPWLLPLLAALVVRFVVWPLLPYYLPNPVPISDEGEYRAAATWLAQGRDFSFFTDWIWTRPPVYVAFLAAHIKLFGPVNLAPIRASQALLSTLTVALVMAWAYLLAPVAHARKVALITGWLVALGYNFAVYSFLLLSETLFMTLLFAAFLALTLWAQRRHFGWLVLGGVLLGLGALTRALLAGTLPLIAAWVWWTAAQRLDTPRRWLRALVAPALLTVVVSSLILPWSVHNTRLFGAKKLILIDTTGGYNAMYAAQGTHFAYEAAEQCRATPANCPAPRPRNQDEVYRELSQVRDQSERQSVAYATALRWIGENPAGFAAKTATEFLDLVRVNFGGAERLNRGFSVGEIPLGHLLGLLSDDLLYTIVAPLAVLGLFRRQGRPGKGLALIWLGYNLVTGPLFFAINRFRIPLVPVLSIYAACALVEWRVAWPSRNRRLLASGLVAALLVLLLPSMFWVPPALAETSDGCDAIVCKSWRGIRSAWVARDCVRAEAVLREGDLAQAQALINRGTGRLELPCFALVQARLDQRRGQTDAALQLMREAADSKINLGNARVLMLEGDIYRSLGQPTEARDRFVPRTVELQNDLDWAWQHLDPPPTTRIDVGGGLDLGLVTGFEVREYTDRQHPFETGYRWMGPTGRLKFVGSGTGQPQKLVLRVQGERPAGEPAATLTIRVLGTDVNEQRPLPPGWVTLEIAIPAIPAGQDVVVQLESTLFVPSPRVENSEVQQQPRFLGIKLDWAEVQTP